MAPDTTTSAATEGGGLSQEAVSYSKGTAEWRILNRKLGQLTTRVRRADAHQPTTREWFNKAIEKSGKTIPYVTKSSFRYSKLGDKEIRLLRLYQSKHPDDPLKADLFKRKLDDVDREYEALSYCWGTESADHEIQVRDLNATGPAVRNGTTKPGQENMIDTFRETIGAITHTEFKIRKNLHDALKQLRRKYGDVYLWVDAICIDQSSEGREEKQRQLAMMARIYNSAATVCVWLGEDKGEAEKAFRLARDIMNYKRFDEMIHDRNKMIDWQSLTAIMRADWFSRRWVIQEIALSRNATIHCGEHSLHWDDFADAVSLLVEKIELMRVGFRHELFDDVETSSASILIQTLGNICRKSDEDHDRGAISSRLLDVETLVSTLLAFQATFPRDTIYSILSLAKDFPKSQEAWELLHEEQILEVRKEKLKRLAIERGRCEAKRHIYESDLSAGEEMQSKIEKLLHTVASLKKQLIEAKENRQESRAQKIAQEIQAMDEDQLLKIDSDRREVETSLDRCKVQIKQLDLKYQRTEQEVKTNPIGILPNYGSSPRDLFIAFVTRSIHQTGSLDIICRHWAPDLERIEDGADQMPSWISARSKAPFGLPGTARGRQNGENLVAYLPHDQRRRYSASAGTKADIKMLLDPGLTQVEEAVPQIGLSPPTQAPSLLPRADGEGGKQPAQQMSVSRNVETGLERGERDGYFDENGGSPRSTEREAETSERGSISGKSRRRLPRGASLRATVGRMFSQKAEQSGTEGHGAPAEASLNHVERQAEGQDVDTAVNGRLELNGNRAQATVSVPKKPPKKPMGANFPSASLWAPGPHRLSGIMVVEGFILGIIKSQSDVMRGGIIPGEWVARLGWKKNEENQVPDTLWRLLVADRMAQGARPPLWYKRACLHGLVDQRVTDNAGNIHPVTPVDRKISEQTTTYFKRVESIVWNRRIFELTAFEEKTGGPPIASGSQPARSTAKILPKPMMLYGLGPEESRVDHIVCILYGCSVPVVLKVAEQQRVSGLYEVVGEAYVDGIMDGEFMIEKWTSRAREFRLG